MLYGLIMMLQAAAQVPAVPSSVQVIDENGALVMRTLPDGKPLYTYDKDSGGVSACVDRCAVAWPPLMASATAKRVGDWTTVRRNDGSTQWAYKGSPVYLYGRDVNSKASGDGIGGVWHLLPTTRITP